MCDKAIKHMDAGEKHMGMGRVGEKVLILGTFLNLGIMNPTCEEQGTLPLKSSSKEKLSSFSGGTSLCQEMGEGDFLLALFSDKFLEDLLQTFLFTFAVSKSVLCDLP